MLYEHDKCLGDRREGFTQCPEIDALRADKMFEGLARGFHSLSGDRWFASRANGVGEGARNNPKRGFDQCGEIDALRA